MAVTVRFLLLQVVPFRVADFCLQNNFVAVYHCIDRVVENDRSTWSEQIRLWSAIKFEFRKKFLPHVRRGDYSESSQQCCAISKPNPFTNLSNSVQTLENNFE